MWNQGQRRFLIFLTLIGILVTCSQAFILQTGQGFDKCFSSPANGDKTLQIRFGFPRKAPLNCAFILTINFKNLDHKQGNNEEIPQQNNIHREVLYCNDMNPRQPFVYKHIPTEDQHYGSYEICVANHQDLNYNNKNTTMFELEIIERYDPHMMEEIDGMSLITSNQLRQIEVVVAEMRSMLNWCNEHIKNAQKGGDSVLRILGDVESQIQWGNYLQFGILAAYGIFWLGIAYKVLK